MSNIYDKLRSDLYEEHNKLRTNPSSYIKILEEDMLNFKNNILLRPGNIAIQTYEGKLAYEEAIQFLKTQKSLNPLNRSEHLENAAQLHAKDSGENGLVSHEGSDGRNLSERIEEQCEWSNIIGENIDFNSKTAVHVIISLLVNDGVSGRSHRAHLFNANYNFIGIGVNAHKIYGNIVVIKYAGHVREKGTAYFDYDNYRYEPQEIKTIEIKNIFQQNDPDAPDDCVSFKTEKLVKSYKDREVYVTKKMYTLSNGTQHVVEIEDL